MAGTTIGGASVFSSATHEFNPFLWLSCRSISVIISNVLESIVCLFVLDLCVVSLSSLVYLSFYAYTNGSGTAYLSGAPEFTRGCSGDEVYSIFSFMCIFHRSLCVLLSLFFWPLCCLFFDSNYPFGIFKLLLCQKIMNFIDDL